MKYYIEIEDDIISSKGIVYDDYIEFNKPFLEVTEEFYELITVPSSFELNSNNEIINVIKVQMEPVNTDVPLTQIEILQQKINEQDMVLEELMFVIIPEMMGGGI